MIDSILLVNFQKHKRKFIKLDKINCLTGPNDRGKTTVIRALQWVALNQPSGTSMVRWGEDTCKVTIKVDGHKITRLRSPYFNGYILDGIELKCGTGVPEEVQKILRITPANFQGQWDSIFWFTESDGEIGKNLNKIVDLEIIDTGFKNLNEELRKSKTKLAIHREELLKSKEKRDSVKWVEKYDKDLKKVEKLYEEIEEIREEEFQGREMVERLTSCQEKIEKGTKLLKKLDHLVKLGEEVTKEQEQVDELESLLEKITYQTEAICEGESRLRELNKKLKKVKVCPICGAKMS